MSICFIQCLNHHSLFVICILQFANKGIFLGFKLFYPCLNLSSIAMSFTNSGGVLVLRLIIVLSLICVHCRLSSIAPVFNVLISLLFLEKESLSILEYGLFVLFSLILQSINFRSVSSVNRVNVFDYVMGWLLPPLIELLPIIKFNKFAGVVHGINHINLFILELMHFVHKLLPSIQIFDSLIGPFLFFSQFYDPCLNFYFLFFHLLLSGNCLHHLGLSVGS